MDKLTLIKALLCENEQQASNTNDDFIVGKNYLIRTVTHYYTGKVVRVNNMFVHLCDAAWIADTGRFYDQLSLNEFNEVEPYVNNVGVGLGAIVDFTEIQKLPREQK